MERDPIIRFGHLLTANKVVDDAIIEEMDKQKREIVVAAMKYAEESPWPSPATLEEDVYAHRSERTWVLKISNSEKRCGKL